MDRESLAAFPITEARTDDMAFRRRKLKDRFQTFVDEVLHILGQDSICEASALGARTVQVARLEARVLMSASPMALVAEAVSVAAEAGVSIMTADAPEISDDFDSNELRYEADAYNGEIDTSSSDTSSSGDSAEQNSGTVDPLDSDPISALQQLRGTATTSSDAGPELIVIDYRVQDADELLSSLLTEGRDVRLLRLGSDDAGLSEITAKLEQIGNVSAIHLLTHGRDGEILLGATRLNSATLAQHAPELLAWQHSLTADADLLLYGCDVAESPEGQDFIDALHSLTGAAIAASTDATGGQAFGGNWELEYQVGAVETQVFGGDPVFRDWNDLLGIITVSTTNDVLDGDTSSVAALLANNGADGFISLREAIIATNNTAGADTIVLTAGTFTLTIGGQGENAGLTGDLDITDSLTITGAASGASIIHGNSLDRVFELRGSASVTMEDLTIRGGLMGSSDSGGGILIDHGSTLNLMRVVVTGNNAGHGAGIYNLGTLTATDTSLVSNTSTDSGGGLYNDAGNITLHRVTISGNTANKHGAGIYNTGNGAQMALTNVTLSGNTATNDGGGLWTSQLVNAINVTIAFNEASGGDGVYMQGGSGDVSLTNSVLFNPAGENANRAMTSLGNNIDSDNSALLTQPTDQRGIDPLLDPMLQNHGGFVATHRLLADSPAIDAGNSATSTTTDARGAARIGTADVGAYEFIPVLTPTGEQRVNETTGQTQATSALTRGSTNAVSVMPSGNFVVVWSSSQTSGADADGYGVWMRIYRPDGTALTGEVPVNQTTAGDQQWATVATDDQGNGVVVWTSTGQDNGTTNGVYGRRFDATGNFVGNEFLINATSDGTQEDAVVAMTGSGEFVVAWSGNGTGDSSGIYYRRFDATGTAMDVSERQANATDLGTEIGPSIAVNDAGQFAIAWYVGNDLYMRNFAASGNAVTADVLVDNGLANAEDVAIGIDGTGRTTVVYRTDGVLGLGEGIWGRSFNADGTQRQTWNLISGGSTERSPSIAMAEDGRFAVAYQGTGDGTGSGIFVRRYNADFSVQTGEVPVNETTAGNQQMPSIALLDVNNYVVVWSGQGTDDAEGVFARQFHISPPTLDLDANDNSGSSGSDFNTQYTDGAGPVAIVDADAVLSDSNNANLQSLRVTITNRSNGSNEILSAVTTGTSITASYTNGTLTLTGSDTVARYQQVLRTITYNNLQIPSTGSPRIITFVANDGVSDSNVGTTRVFMNATTNVAPVITSNGGDSTASINVSENSTAVTTVTATDANVPAQTLTYSISGGADAARFAINSSTGVLSFVTAPDFEAPQDNGTNNIYEVNVHVTDGMFSDTQAITVNVQNVNDIAPLISSGQTFSVSDQSTAGTSLGYAAATDADAGGATTFTNWTITGGNSDGIFAINSTTGELTVAVAGVLNFDTNSAYLLTLTVSDGTNTSAAQTVSIAVEDGLNTAPVAADDSYTVAEGGTVTESVISGWFNSNWNYRQQLTFDNSASTTNLTNMPVLVKLHASAADAIHIDYQATQNAGQDLRFVDSSGAILEYQIEEWNESGYSYVWVKVPQIAAGSTTGSMFMYYGNSAAEAGQNTASVWSSNYAAVFHMNTNAIDSTGNSNNGLVSNVVITGGVISGAGTFNGSNSFINAQSAPSVDNIFAGGGAISSWINPTGWGEGGYGRIADKGTNTTGANGWGWQVAGSNSTNGYLFFESDFSGRVGQWRTAAGTLSLNSWQHVVVVYDNSSTSNTPQIFVNGTQLAVTRLSTPSGTARSDAAQNLFIGNRSGNTDRTFNGMIDEVRISSTPLTADQIRADYKSVRGTFITSGGVVAGLGGLLGNDFDANEDALTVSLVSGPSHAASFTLNPDGSFSYVHDGSETATDSFTYRTSDHSSSDIATVYLTITPVNDSVPVITSNGSGTSATISVAENTTFVTTVTATDADLPTQTLVYSIIGGSDASNFTINSSTGTLSFLVAPDYEAPTDVGTDRVYNVVVRVSDGSLTDTQEIAVSVTNVNEQPIVNGDTYTVNEDTTLSIGGSGVLINDTDPENDAITAVIVDGVSHGSLKLNADGSFVYTPNANFNGTDSFRYRATDGLLNSSPVTVTLNVMPVNDAPVVSLANSQRNYTEQASSISIDSSLTISDIDSTHLTGATVTITNGDVSGMDELIFTSVFGITGVFDAATDTLTFSGTASVSSYQTILRSVRFRNMSDTPLASVRTVTVQVTDGSATAGDSRNIRVEAINDAPIITSNGGTNSASVNVSEYTTAVTTVTTSDVDGGTASYSISGGSDQTHFIINSTTGVLEFVTAQRFLTPTDADGNNTYEVQVQVSDGYGGTDTQLLQVHVRNVNEVPTSTAIPTVTVAEDSNPFVIQTASSFADPDLDTLSYQIVHVDSATSLFNSLTVNSTTGVVSVSLRANAHGTAVVTLRATDPTGLFTDEQLTINVLPVNDAPVVRNYVGSIVSSQTLTVSAPGVLQGASDVEGQTIQAVLIQGPQHGTLTLSANGRFVYRPNEGYFGFDSFRFAGTDGVATGATATATIEVTAPPTSTSSSGSSSSSSSSGSSSTTSTTSSSGSTNGASSTTTTNTSSSAGASSSATTSGTGTQSTTANTSSAPALSGTNNITEGAETTSESNSDDDDDRLMGLYTPKTAESKDTLMIKVAVSDFNSQSHVRDESRRYGSGDVFAKGPDHFYSNWDSRSELTPQELERQLIYRELAVRSEAQINDFEEKLTRNINMDGRVVGSVGVVTTGFSVGYLIWAVRGGMLLSGVLSQIPAWTMLDPLMVIDGEGKEDDKESLQTIMDRQQAKLNSNPQPSHLPAESRISDS